MRHVINSLSIIKRITYLIFVLILVCVIFLVNHIFNHANLPIIEIKPKTNFYNFDAKYNRQDTEFICPANLSNEFIEKINEKSLDAFFSLGCTGYGRVDFMIDDKKELFFIEVNTIPGFTDHSLMPMSAKVIGKNFDDLVLDILGETCD